MSQVEVLEILRRENREMTTREVCEMLDINFSNTWVALDKLLRQDEIIRIKYGRSTKWKIK